MSFEQREIVLKGIGICPGIAIGPPFILTKDKSKVASGKIERKDIELELNRYRRAIFASQKELEDLRKGFAGEGLALIDAHLILLRDPEWVDAIEGQIGKLKNTEAAIMTTVNRYKLRFSRLDDPRFQDRFTDIQDVANRLLKGLEAGSSSKAAKKMPKSAVFFSDEISTSDTFWSKKAGVTAFVSRKGGPTCHAAIIARAQGLPYVVGVDVSSFPVEVLETVIVDGENGVVILNPTKEHLRAFQRRQKEVKAYELKNFPNTIEKASTRDGTMIGVHANIDYSDDFSSFSHSIEGVGLFRSESIALNRGVLPSEEEQFAVYKELVLKVKGKSVVIRTFDLGGDKQVHTTVVENNPFLGCRATRLLLREKHLLRAQLRAILRASHFGRVRILFPMISTLEELLEVLEVLKNVKQELQESGIPFDKKVLIGCMIEVPSAALIADKIAHYCDFLSIGTNDLVQYTMAVDRGNALLSHLYNPLHPAVLRLIELVVKAASHLNRPVSVCGEMASDVRFIPYLVGLGIKEISVNPRVIPEVKSIISKIDLLEAKNLLSQIL